MILFDLRQTTHKWEKENLITGKDGSDIYVCSLCGLKAKRPALTPFLSIANKFVNKVYSCPKAIASATNYNTRFVRIEYIQAFNPNTKYLKEGTVHGVILPPEEHESKYPNGPTTVWVWGTYEPFRLLADEFEFVEPTKADRRAHRIKSAARTYFTVKQELKERITHLVYLALDLDPGDEKWESAIYCTLSDCALSADFGEENFLTRLIEQYELPDEKLTQRLVDLKIR